MEIIKLEHSGLAVEKDGKILLCDPVEFTTKLPKFENVTVLILTHKHDDHFQPTIVKTLVAENPALQIFTTEDTASAVAAAADPTHIIIVKPGDIKDAGGFHLEFFGGNHAEIREGQIPCQNIGVVIDGTLANPGDSFDLPPVQPQILAAPISAPWCKIIETANYVEQVQPKEMIPVHDAVLSDLGKTYNLGWLKMFCDANQIELRR